MPIDKLKSLNMCDFCSQEIETCGAKMIRLQELYTETDTMMDPDAVVACNKYESPVEVLKKRFH